MKNLTLLSVGLSCFVLLGCQEDGAQPSATNQSQPAVSVSNQPTADTDTTTEQSTNTYQQVTFQAAQSFEAGQWRIQSPSGEVQEGTLGADENFLDLANLGLLEDGTYQYEVTVTEVTGYEITTGENGRTPGQEKPVVRAEKTGGSFTIKDGQLFTGEGESEE